MNLIDSHRHVDEGVTVWNCRMPVNRLPFANELVLHACHAWASAEGPKRAFAPPGKLD